MRTPKKKRDMVFIGSALLIVFMLFIYSFFTIRFLSKQVRSAITSGGTGTALLVRFDFDTLNRILMDRNLSLEGVLAE